MRDGVVIALPRKMELARVKLEKRKLLIPKAGTSAEFTKLKSYFEMKKTCKLGKESKK